MPGEFSKTDVEHVAALARLRLTDEEKRQFAGQLAEILRYAEQVRQLDTSGIPATSHVLDRHPADRPDEARPSLPLPDAIANAPDAAADEGLFKVPRVIGG